MKYTSLLFVAFIIFSCSKEKPPVDEPETPKVSYVDWLYTCNTGGQLRASFRTHNIPPRATVEVQYMEARTRLVPQRPDEVSIINYSEPCSATAKVFFIINGVVEDSTRVTCEACE